MAGDGDVSVVPTGERIPFLFEASASEMASLVTNRATVQYNPISHAFTLAWFDETDAYCSIPLREDPEIDIGDGMTSSLGDFIACWEESPAKPG